MRLVFLLPLLWIFTGCQTAVKEPLTEEQVMAPCLAALEAHEAKGPYQRVTRQGSDAVTEYPKEAQRRMVPGCVAVAFDISKEGKPENFQRLAEYPPDLGFMESTINAMISNWKFDKKAAKNRTYAVAYRAYKP